MNDNMKPVDVGAPRLIPKGNLTDNPGSYASLRKELDSKKYTMNTVSSAFPGFKPGFGYLEGDWQSSTIK